MIRLYAMLAVGTPSPQPGPPRTSSSAVSLLFRQLSATYLRLLKLKHNSSRPLAARTLLTTQSANMFALRKLPAMVGHRAGSLQMLAPRQAAMYASRSRSALFCAAQSKSTGAAAGAKGRGLLPVELSARTRLELTRRLANTSQAHANGSTCRRATVSACLEQSVLSLLCALLFCCADVASAASQPDVPMPHAGFIAPDDGSQDLFVHQVRGLLGWKVAHLRLPPPAVVVVCFCFARSHRVNLPHAFCGSSTHAPLTPPSLGSEPGSDVFPSRCSRNVDQHHHRWLPLAGGG